MKQRSFAPNPPLPIFDGKPKDNSESPLASNGDSVKVVKRLLQNINVSLIDANHLAPREVYTSKMILERAEDLRSQGQHDPIHVIPNPDVPGRFIIADGWTRVLSCLQHQVFDELLAEIHTDLSLEEAAWFGYEQNECRQGHCDLDRAMFYEKVINAGQSAAEVARRAKLSKTLMTFYKAYSKLPEDVLEIVRQNPAKFSANVAYQLSKLHEACGIRRTVSLSAKFAEEEQTFRWLIGQVQSAVNPPDTKTKAPLKHVRYANGFFKQRGDGFEISIHVSPEKREAFSIALEKLLDTVAVEEAERENENISE